MHAGSLSGLSLSGLSLSGLSLSGLLPGLVSDVPQPCGPLLLAGALSRSQTPALPQAGPRSVIRESRPGSLSGCSPTPSPTLVFG